MSVHAESAERTGRSGARKAERGDDRAAAIAGLDLLRAVGWLVLHDVAVPGDVEVPIDHVLAGPSGVYVINTIGGSGPVRMDDNSLLVGGISQFAHVEDVAAAALALREAIGGRPVVPILCFQRSDEVAGVVAKVAVCSTENILELLNSQPKMLDAVAANDVMRTLNATLERQTTGRRTLTVADAPAEAKPRHKVRKRLLGFGKSAPAEAQEAPVELAVVAPLVEVPPVPEVDAAAVEAERLAAEEARAEAERVEAERVEAERLEAERLAAEEAARAEAERLAAEEAARVEAERLAAEEAARAEAERLAAEEAARVEAERLAAEEAARAEAERLAAEEAARVEAERLAAEEAARVEAERLAAEEAARVEAERLAAEEAARVEAERLAAEEAARVEAERLAAEEAARAEAERLAAEEAARVEAERLAAEEAARAEAERLEAERLAAEEAARAEAERLAAEEAARVEAERLEAERLAAEEAARAEAERLAAEEAARVEAERLAAEEAARVEAERLAAEEAARVEAERLAAEEAARVEAERLEAERLAAEEAARVEAERLAAEKAARREAKRQADEEARREAERLKAELAAQVEFIDESDVVEDPVEDPVEDLVEERPVARQTRGVDSTDPVWRPIGPAAKRVDVKSAIKMVSAAFARREEEPDFSLDELEATYRDEEPAVRSLPAWFGHSNPSPAPATAPTAGPTETEPGPRKRRSLMPAAVAAAVVAVIFAVVPRVPDAYAWGRSFFVTPPPPSLGESAVIGQTASHPAIRMMAGVPLSVKPANGVSAGKGRHWVGVPIQAMIQGDANWTLPVSRGIRAVDNLGVPLAPSTRVTKVTNGKVLPSRLTLVPGRTVVGMVVFAVQNGRHIGTVKVTLASTDGASVWAAEDATE